MSSCPHYIIIILNHNNIIYIINIISYYIKINYIILLIVNKHTFFGKTCVQGLHSKHDSYIPSTLSVCPKILFGVSQHFWFWCWEFISNQGFILPQGSCSKRIRSIIWGVPHIMAAPVFAIYISVKYPFGISSLWCFPSRSNLETRILYVH